MEKSKDNSKKNPKKNTNSSSDNTSKDKALEELKEKTKQSLDKLILEKFPKKILELNKLIEEKFNVKGMSTLTSTVNIPIPDKPSDQKIPETTPQSREGIDKRVFLFPNGVNESNEQIVKLSAIVKPLLLDFVTDMRTIKYAIQLMIPKVEDGHNFGVAIQESAIHIISHSANQAGTRLGQFTRYHNHRGNIITWIARYPHCDDYRRCLQEEDQKFYLILCLIIRELRDGYISLNDLIVKNMDKIKKPRPVRDVNIY